VEEGSSTTAVARGLVGTLSATGNRRSNGTNAVPKAAMLEARHKRPGATEKQVNIPAPQPGVLGNLTRTSKVGDAAGISERGSPSLLRVPTAPGSMHCAANWATGT